MCYLSKVLSRLIELEIQAVSFAAQDELSAYRRTREDDDKAKKSGRAGGERKKKGK